MPIYEYQCQACNKRYELQQSFSAETTHTCEKCGRGTAKRILHAPTVVFKGSGFYVTDNKPGRVAKDDSDSAGDSSKTETKAAKSEKPSDPKKAASKKSDSGSAAEAAV